MSTYDILTRIASNTTLAIAGVTDSVPIIGLTGLPLTLAGLDVGRGAKLAFRLFWNATVDVGVASVTFSVIVSDTAALGAPTILGSKQFVNSQMQIGREMDIEIPSTAEAAAVGQAFIGLGWLASAIPATGAFSAWIPLGDSVGRPQLLRANYTGP